VALAKRLPALGAGSPCSRTSSTHVFIEENDLYFFSCGERALAWGAEECLALAAQTVDARHDWL
jgi:hypothetical protein